MWRRRGRLQQRVENMSELRIAKDLLRKATLYAEQHAINRVAPISGDSTNASQNKSSTALRVIKLQVCGLQLGVSSNRSVQLVPYSVRQH